MAAYTMTGTLKVMMEQQTFDSGFTKREFVVTSKDEKYPQDIKFEAVQERTAMLDGLDEGDEVAVTFDLRGNEYNGKYYVNLRAWKLDKGSAAASGGTVDGERPPLPFEVPEDIDLDGEPPF